MPAPSATEQEFAARLAGMGASHVHVGILDPDGLLRSKRVSAAKAQKLLHDGYAFCDVLHNWDSAEQTYGGGIYVDRPARLDPATLRRWPFEGDEAVVIADFEPPFGLRSARHQLLAQLDKAAAMGFTVHAAFEFEINILAETADSLREKGFAAPRPFAAANRTYSLQTLAEHRDLLAGLEAMAGVLEIGVDALHTELGPGCIEVPLAHAPGVRAADDAALFKNFARAYFRRHGLTACFMSKLDAGLSGQSGHLHLSLRDARTGAPVFAAPGGISPAARHFIGGLLRLMPEMLALCSHTVNAYKRMVPGMWAPTHASWGIQNRTAALRVINDTPQATRVEFRVPSADTNPHAAMLLCLAAGLWGIENWIEPDFPARADDCYATPAPAGAGFPADLGQAAERLAASATARALLGDVFVDGFVRARQAEHDAWRRHVTAWEIRRYIEIV